MEVGDVAAWFAAGIAIIAAFIAMSNANSAKTQAGAALKQASEAQKAREAAEAQVKIAEANVVEARRSAEAAREQVTLLSKQISMAEQDRHEQNAPEFTVTYSPSFGHVGQASWHTISYTSGPSQLDKITISPAPDCEVDGVGIDEDEQNRHASIELRSVVRGVERKFVAWLNDDDSGVVFLVDAENASGSWGPDAVKATDDY